eukprot:5143242-Amphidinium_carterae.1
MRHLLTFSRKFETASKTSNASSRKSTSHQWRNSQAMSSAYKLPIGAGNLSESNQRTQTSRAIMKRSGDRGSPCAQPLVITITLRDFPLFNKLSRRSQPRGEEQSPSSISIGHSHYPLEERSGFWTCWERLAQGR